MTYFARLVLALATLAALVVPCATSAHAQKIAAAQQWPRPACPPGCPPSGTATAVTPDETGAAGVGQMHPTRSAPRHHKSRAVELIIQTATDICATIREAHGRRPDTKIRRDVETRLSGLSRKLADIEGTTDVSGIIEGFKGLPGEAAALARQGDRECREKLADRMLDLYYEPESQD